MNDLLSRKVQGNWGEVSHSSDYSNSWGWRKQLNNHVPVVKFKVASNFSKVTCVIFKGHTNLIFVCFKYENYFFPKNFWIKLTIQNMYLICPIASRCLGNTSHHHEGTSGPGWASGKHRSCLRIKVWARLWPLVSQQDPRPPGLQACLCLSALSPLPGGWFLTRV